MLGVGIAISGLVNRKKGTVIRSTMLGWENVALEAMLHAHFPDIPVYVDKNINCYTLAELWLGEGKQSNNFATVSVGAGLGLSVVINRQIYYGAQGGAGEFGHTTIQPGGYKCHCGQKGCLEMYASEFYFRNRGEELKEAYPTSELNDFHFDKVAKSARAGDEMATELMGKMGEYLGYGIRNIINTFNPEKVIIVGEGLHHRDLFLTKIDEIASQNFFSGAGFETEITTTSLEDPAWLQGAALLVIHQLFQVPIYEEEQTLLR